MTATGDDTSVLVTGAAGFIGRHLVAQMRAHGVDVVEVAHRWSDIAEVERAIGQRAIRWCAHLGWYAAPSDYLTSVPENWASLERSLELADLLGRIGCRRLVVAGSCAEYAPSNAMLTEADAITPWSVYGATKAALHLLLDSSLAPALTVAWARLFNVTGPGEHPDRLLPWILREVQAGRRVPLSSGTQLRDFLDVSDVARALAALGASDAAGPFNVSSGTGVPLREIIERLVATDARRALLDFGARPHPDHDPPVMVGDNQRLTAATGWLPAYDLDTTLARVAAFWASSDPG